MKKLFKSFIALALVFVLVACGGGGDKLAEGKYQAAGATADNGWTSFVAFDVKDGKMENFKFDSVNLMTGDQETKAQQAAAGKYNMQKGGESWDIQAKKIEDFVMEKQGLDDVKFDKDGKTDAVSGATVSFGELPALIKAAKDAGPVKAGDLKDGVHFAQAAKKDNNGFTYILGYFVNDGIIIAAHADAFKIDKVDGKETKVYKTVLSKAGKYNLADNAVGPYYEQAAKVVQHILDNQALDVKVDDKGKSDAISGATINIGNWVTLFQQAK